MKLFTNQKFYLMKRKTLQNKNARSICTLALVFLFALFPFMVNAQPNDYTSDMKEILVATSDSRLTASIYETETTVSVKVLAIGHLEVNYMAFSLFFDPSVIRFSDPTYQEVTKFGLVQNGPANSLITLNQELVDKFWYPSVTHKNVGSNPLASWSGHQTMRSVLFDLVVSMPLDEMAFKVEAGKVVTVFEAYFVKQNPGEPLTNDDIGIAVKSTPIFYQPKLGNDGLFLWYRELNDLEQSVEFRKITPELFLFRSGNSLETSPASNLATTSAILNGYYEQGKATLPISNTLLDTVGTALTGTAKMRHDDVIQYGFIYSTDDVVVTIAEFSDSIKIGTVNYALPTPTEIAAGAFARGGYNFKIVLNNNSSNVEATGYSNPVTGLVPNQEYFAWAYTLYSFETSDTYQAVGNKISFTTTDCIALNIGTVFTYEEPVCGADNGKIQVHVTGGSGVYEFRINDETDFKTYTNNIITGLAAGTYKIEVRDHELPMCPTSTIDNVVLHSATTDLSVSLTAVDAATCGSNGYLTVNVTGGKPEYQYLLNGAVPTIINGTIAQPVGEYELVVTDGAGCVATSGKVRINAQDSQLALNVSVTQHTVCEASTGIAKFTVSGTTEFYYQLDGFPEVKVSNVNGDTTISLTGLSAGIHYLRVTDECGEVVKDFPVYNGNANGFAFAATSTNEMLDCNGDLLPGSITLVVNNGTGGYEYRIDGGAWLPFISATNTEVIAAYHGIYRIEVKDQSECIFEVNQITVGRDIYTPINVGTIFAAYEPNCNANDGKIQVFATGGSGSYLYAVNGGNPTYYAGGLITGLKAGAYEISVYDSLYTACTEVAIGNIVLHNNNTDLNVTLVAENASSCTLEDGILYVTVTGGIPQYTYLLNGVVPSIVDGMIMNQPAGSYELLVTDGSGCIATSGIVHIGSDVPSFAANVTVTQQADCGLSTGSATLTVTGSNAYSYQLDGYLEVNVTGNAPVVLNGLSAGIHSLRIWDNCTEVVKEFTIYNGTTNGFAFTATPATEILDCNGDLLPGSITLAVSNGSGNYSYSINGSNWTDFTASTQTITGLHSGVYRVEVKDVNGCAFEVNHIIISREIYTPIHVGTIFAAYEPNCNADDGKIQVYATGGSGSYLYAVNGENPIAYPGGLITGLKAGSYEISVYDAVYTSCSEVTVGNIVLHNGNTDLNVILTANDAETCGTNGSLNVTVTGGKLPYTYSLNGSVPTIVDGMILNRPVGEYELVVTHVTGCVATSGIVRISAVTPSFAANVNVTQHADCGLNTGSATLTVNGTTSFTYQLDGYAVQTSTGTNSIVFNGLSAGIHSLRIWDACTETIKEFTIFNGSANGFSIEATPESEILACDGALLPGSITLNVSNGSGFYEYSIDGSAWLAFTGSTETITGLHQGSYLVEVRDVKNGCTFEVNNVTISRETSFGTLIMPPVATTPQTFCSTATVANLQAQGVGIKWYLTPEGGDALSVTTTLTDGTIYYAAQSFGTCESQERTAVKVFIDNDVVLETPHIESPQSFCNTSGTLTLDAIATDGNTNIKWYAEATGGNSLPLTTLLEEKTYYAVIEVGNCQSSPRVAVEVTFTTTAPGTPKVDNPQYFCEGALIGNIAVPNNKILWYLDATGGNPLPETYPLQDNTIYYAAQVAGECESTVRAAVTVHLTQPVAPVAPDVQPICGKITIADLTITGAGIVWFDAQTGGNILPLTTQLESGKSYWAAQVYGDCASDRVEITITNECYVAYGTIFPFVHINDDNFNAKFPVTVKLFELPAKDGNDPLMAIHNSTSIQTVHATFYDGSVFIPGTPRNPGVIGNTNNPGLEISWEDIGKTVGTIDNTLLTENDNTPSVPIGMYKFENMAPGDYVIEISRQGYVTRYGVITIDIDGKSLGHRELIAGDVTGDFMIDGADVSSIISHFTDNTNVQYDPRYDLNGDGNANSGDFQIIIGNLNANIGTYLETLEWINSYY